MTKTAEKTRSNGKTTNRIENEMPIAKSKIKFKEKVEVHPIEERSITITIQSKPGSSMIQGNCDAKITKRVALPAGGKKEKKEKPSKINTKYFDEKHFNQFHKDINERVERQGDLPYTDSEAVERYMAACKYLHIIKGKPFAKGTIYGVRAEAIKSGAVEASINVEEKIKTRLRGLFFIRGEGPKQLIPIKCSQPIIRMDLVPNKNAQGNPKNEVYRPEFVSWSAELKIEFDSSNITAEQVINFVNRGGYHQGIGEKRPGKMGGDYGQYEVKLGRTK